MIKKLIIAFVITLSLNTEKCIGINKNDSLDIIQLLDTVKYYKQVNPTKAMQINDSLINICDKQNAYLIGQCYQAKAVLYFRLSKSDSAQLYLNLALTHFRKIENINGIQVAMGNYGNIYFEKGDFENALNYYDSAYIFALELSDTIKILRSIVNKTNVLLELKHNTEALKNSKAALTYLNNKTSPTAKAYVYSILYTAYQQLDDMENFEKYTKLAIDAYSQQNDSMNIAITYTNMADVFALNNSIDKAIALNKKALRVFKNLNFHYGSIHVYSSQAKNYRAKGLYTKSTYYFEKSLVLAEKYQLNSVLETLYKELYINYLFTKDIEKSNRFLAKSDSLQAIVFTESLNEKVADLQTKYNTLEKEQEIQKLSTEKAQQKLQLKNERKNRLLAVTGLLFALVVVIAWFLLNRSKQKQRQIELSRNKSDMENKLLRSQMNPHFMFNSLNSVQNYILKNDKMEACNYLSNFSDLMRNILQNSRLSLIPLDEELETLDKYLQLEQLRFKDKLSYSIKTDLGMDASEINIPPMILQPYIENAIIHGIAPKKEMGNISVFVEYDAKNSQLKCSISDNGIGRKAAANNKKPSHAKSLGMLVTSERLQQLQNETGLKAQVNIHDLLDGEKAMGTKVEVIIPIEKLN